jgi:hypothetical protein
MRKQKDATEKTKTTMKKTNAERERERVGDGAYGSL